MKKNFFIFCTIFVLGTILGSMGTISFPIYSNISYFWPASVIQTISGIFFGWPGILAGTMFPCITNGVTDGSIHHICGFIPANFIQCALPFYFARKLKISIYNIKLKDYAMFTVFCAIIPHAIGAVVGCTYLYFIGEITNMFAYGNNIKVWLIGNIPCSIIFGILFIKFLTPVLKDSNILISEIQP
ncbi:MAG: hypothetical protein ABIA04_14170 [Pseudomonadota bacterium]